MSYERLNLQDGDTLTAKHIAHMEKGIEKAEKGNDGAIAVADYYDKEKTYGVDEVCANDGLLYRRVRPGTVLGEFNRDEWQQTKLYEFSLWRYIVNNHRYMEVGGVPTYQANTAYHAKCAAVPCKKGDTFYYTGRAHHSGMETVKNWWIVDEAGNVLSSQNYGTAQQTRLEVVVTDDNAAKILFNFCLSPTGGADAYPYGLKAPGYIDNAILGGAW